jgi:hypothetical protein
VERAEYFQRVVERGVFLEAISLDLPAGELIKSSLNTPFFLTLGGNIGWGDLSVNSIYINRS